MPGPPSGRRANIASMLWNSCAVLIGMIAGMSVNMALITLNSKVLYPAPAGLDMKDRPAFQAYVDTLPTPAFLVVMAAHLGQAFTGGLVAAWLGATAPITLAMIVGGLSLIGGAMMMRMVKGPKWMLIELPLYPVVAYLAGSLIQGLNAAS